MRRGRFRWQTFAAAAALSLAFHVFYVVPRMLAQLVLKHDKDLEVSFVPEPEIDAPDPTAPEREPTPPKTPELPAPPEVAQVDPPKPKEEPPKPPAPVVAPAPAPPPPPPPLPQQRMQFVDQDKFPDEQDNTEGRFLAQKNHRASLDTRGKNSNLIREVESKNDHTSSENDNKDPEPGHKDEKIAELESRSGPDKTMPRSSPRQGEEGHAIEKPRPGPLSMRDLTPRGAVDPRTGQKAREGLEVQEPDKGDLAMARIGRDGLRGTRGEQRKGGKVRLTLDHHDYDAIEGYGTAEKERQKAARAESSHKKGRYDRYLTKLQAMRSTIENFTAEVKPGNQSELGTRAHPFAGYITAMHRQIHKLFAFGFLSDLDGKLSGNTPYDDRTLWSKLEIIVNGDGSVDKVNMVRSSGVTGFDVAAIDSVVSSAPFPRPPKDILSANGKVYLHWQFHRDESACITTGVDPFILTTGETPRDVSGNISLPRAAGGGVPLPQREGPRSLKREAHEEEAPPRAIAPPSHSHTPPSLPVPEVTAEARSAAEGWFAAYTRGDAAWLAGWSATPFVAAGEVLARDAATLKTMYKQLLAEAPEARKLSSFDVLTPAGIRGRLGGLPPGGEDGGMLYAVGRVGKEEFILLLKKSNRGWRVAGLAR